VKRHCRTCLYIGSQQQVVEALHSVNAYFITEKSK
jgi:hypothetical protein